MQFTELYLWDDTDGNDCLYEFPHNTRTPHWSKVIGDAGCPETNRIRFMATNEYTTVDEEDGPMQKRW